MNNYYETYKENIFTKFAANPQSCEGLILEATHTIALYDKFPQFKYHILIIPKNKYIDAYDFFKKASIEEQMDFNATIIKIIEKFDLQNTGFNIRVNNHASHSQLIMHYHLHLTSNGQS